MTFSKLEVILFAIIIILIACGAVFWPKSTSSEKKAAQSLGIASLIDSVKNELIRSHDNQLKSGKSSMFEVKSFDLEIQFTLNKTSADDNHFQFNVVSGGSSTSLSNELVQTVKLHMDAMDAMNAKSAITNSPIDTTKSLVIHLDTPTKKK